MNFRGPIGAGLMLAIAISGVYAAEPLKSGPEVGSKKNQSIPSVECDWICCR